MDERAIEANEGVTHIRFPITEQVSIKLQEKAWSRGISPVALAAEIINQELLKTPEQQV